MSTLRNVFVLTIAAAAAMTFGTAEPVRAAERVRQGAALQSTAAGHIHDARIDVQRLTLRNQSIRLRASGAARGETLTVFLEDENGTLSLVGSVRAEGRSARVRWVVRTARGDALPFGVPDVAFLSGRALEVRTESGDVVLTGMFPSAPRATGMPRRMQSLKQTLVVASTAASAGVEAELEVEREHGALSLTIELEGAVPGLALEAWVRQADGTEAKLGDLVADDEGDEEGIDVDDDTVSDDGTDAEDECADEDTDDDTYGTDEAEYELVLNATTPLPFGAASLADLAGLAIEIRNAADGSVLASGFLPDVSAPDTDADQDESGDDEQTDDVPGDD